MYFTISNKEVSVYRRIGSVQLLNVWQIGRKGQSLRRDQWFKTLEIQHHHIDVWAGAWVLCHRLYRTTVPYQLLFWAFTSSIICNAKAGLSLPAYSEPDGSTFCLMPCVWMRSTDPDVRTPGGSAVVMVTLPITVTEWGVASGGRERRISQHRWLFQNSALHRSPPSLSAGTSPHPHPVH